MQPKTATSQPNTTSEVPGGTIIDLDAILSRLSLGEIRFLVARSEVPTDKEAARIIGLSPTTVKSWSMDRKKIIREALRLMAKDGLVTALHLRRRSLAKAMAVKVKGLESGDDRLRQSVATEIIEWEIGKATQHTELTGKGGGPVETKDVSLTNEERNAAIADILASISEGSDRPPAEG